MATLFQKRGIWYLNYVVDGRRYKVSTGTSNKKLAQVKLDDLRVKLFKGEIGAPEVSSSGASIAQFFSRFMEYCRANYAPEHLQSDLSRIKTMQDFFARKGNQAPRFYYSWRCRGIHDGRSGWPEPEDQEELSCTIKDCSQLRCEVECY